MTQRVILFHYTVSDSSGEVIDSSRGESPMAFLEGTGQLIPGLERVLLTLHVGDKELIEIEAKEAYGRRDPRKIVMVPRDVFPLPEVAVGDLFQLATPGVATPGVATPELARPEGTGEVSPPLPYRVTEVSEKIITLDGNHPLAGIDLICNVEVIEIRDASDEELAHGHAHSADEPHH